MFSLMCNAIAFMRFGGTLFPILACIADGAPVHLKLTGNDCNNASSSTFSNVPFFQYLINR